MRPFLMLLACSAATAVSATAAAEAEQLNPIRLNQLGFLPAGPKRAVVPNASKTPLAWKLVDSAGRTQATGVTRVFGPDKASGDHVHLVDFGSFRGSGAGYRLVVEKASSRPFPLSPTIYDRLPYDALSYFYHNRAGTPIEARFAGGQQWSRPAAHAPERATCVSGADSKGNNWPGCSYTLDVTGGWYDAGDHGKYVVNGGITMWTLLNLYERRQAAGRPSLFADGKARIPEAGNGVDDLLDEARWGMEFFLKMQAPQGARASVPVGAKSTVPGLKFSDIDASGMVHHKVADEKWTSLPMAPHDDPEKRQLFPVSTGATLNLAANAAQCARIWRSVDAAFSARCLAAAERAYQAAKRNPEVYAIADFTGSGGYGDSDLSDEFYWAAAELFATTGDAAYGRDVRAARHFAAPATTEPSWPGVAALGTVTLATLPNKLAKGEVDLLRRLITSAADAFLRESNRVGYRIPYDPPRGYPWGSNSSILNRAMLLALAHDFTGRAAYRDGVVDAMDYVLGRNPMDLSYVSGYGPRAMRNPHHRFWARQLSPKFPPPPPGALSGGPNSTSMSDDVAKPLKGKCTPQKCYRDDIHAFSLNEVAINWNAPLVWVSSYLAERR